MALAMKQDETLNPLDILRFGTDAVMLYPNTVTNLVEQFRGGQRWRIWHGVPYLLGLLTQKFPAASPAPCNIYIRIYNSL
jgi:hypothetical protein